MTQEHLINGYMTEIEDGHSFLFGCCRCSMVHRIIAELIGDNKIRLTVYRDDFQTELRSEK